MFDPLVFLVGAVSGAIFRWLIPRLNGGRAGPRAALELLWNVVKAVGRDR